MTLNGRYIRTLLHYTCVFRSHRANFSEDRPVIVGGKNIAQTLWQWNVGVVTPIRWGFLDTERQTVMRCVLHMSHIHAVTAQFYSLVGVSGRIIFVNYHSQQSGDSGGL